jgi:regulator of nucleoside diphosphate kinase
MNPREIHITEPDMARLRRLLADESRGGRRPDLASLERELRQACVIPAQEIPQDVVTMHSQVVLRDQRTREQSTYTLVFPEEADLERNCISVLAPIGTAILGRRRGDVFEWQVPGGLRKLKIKDILFQPEAAGQFHL